MSRALGAALLYLVSSAAVLIALGFAIDAYGSHGDLLFATAFPLAGLAGFGTTLLFSKHRPIPAPSLGVLTRWWTVAALVLAVVCLQAASIVRGFGPVVMLTILVGALGEELAFRRWPVALQYRLGLISPGHTVLFLAATSAAFVALHSTQDLLPTLEKIIFALCAYYACLVTRSCVLPFALHLAGNTTAAIWVTASQTPAAGVFSVVSIVGSAVALTALLALAGRENRMRVLLAAEGHSDSKLRRTLVRLTI